MHSWTRWIFLFHLCGSIASNPGEIAGVWYTSTPKPLPSFLTVGQIVVQWRDIQLGPHNFTWEHVLSAFHSDPIAQAGGKVTLQVNGNRKPDFLFNLVPYSTAWHDPEAQDPKGILQYWHPVFVSNYQRLLTEYAAFLKTSYIRSQILGIRLNWDAIGTEHGNVPPAGRTKSAWIVPAGSTLAPMWTPPVWGNYTTLMWATYMRTFILEVPKTNRTFIYVRNSLEETIRNAPAQGQPTGFKNIDYFKRGELGWFDTSSEPEPRPYEVLKYDTFLEYCPTGITRCYAEPWSSAWSQGPNDDAEHWSPPPQWIYWRYLCDLTLGLQTVAIYGSNLDVAIEGKYQGNFVGKDYQQSFNASMHFAKKYVGYNNYPQQSPGAWIAFRKTMSSKISWFSVNVTDYRMHMTLANREEIEGLDSRFNGSKVPVVKHRTAPNQYTIGPYHQPYGQWARRLTNKIPLKLELDPKFLQGFNFNKGKSRVIEVTYLDSHAFGEEKGNGRLELANGDGKLVAKFDGILSDKNEWVKVTAPISDSLALQNPLSLSLSNARGLAVHMVHVHF